MQGQRAPPNVSLENVPYSSPVARRPRSDRGPRPKQGAHILALRLSAGLTQIELAKALGLSQSTVAPWEWSKSPPRSDILPKMAKVLGVRVEDLIVQDEPRTVANRPGPVGEVQRVFEEVRRLPRKQQRKILEMVTAVVEQYKRKAS
jgi:transcriptional regulator with XRE-family HTH domain